MKTYSTPPVSVAFCLLRIVEKRAMRCPTNVLLPVLGKWKKKKRSVARYPTLLPVMIHVCCREKHIQQQPFFPSSLCAEAMKYTCTCASIVYIYVCLYIRVFLFLSSGPDSVVVFSYPVRWHFTCCVHEICDFCFCFWAFSVSECVTTDIVYP